MALFFPSSSSPSSFPWMRRDASCHYDISNLAGKTKKREKKATDRWRPGGWHSNVPPCLRRSTKDAGASEGNWKMTRSRERERHGDESKGVDVGNQPVVEEEGRGGCSKRPRESERGGVVACAREKGSRGRRWRRKRERERDGQRRGGRMVKARMKEREEPWSKKGTHKGPLVN